ncbi:hypothetical protein D3C86_1664020 [compost metagenome]
MLLAESLLRSEPLQCGRFICGMVVNLNRFIFWLDAYIQCGTQYRIRVTQCVCCFGYPIKENTVNNKVFGIENNLVFFVWIFNIPECTSRDRFFIKTNLNIQEQMGTFYTVSIALCVVVFIIESRFCSR